MLKNNKLIRDTRNEPDGSELVGPAMLGDVSGGKGRYPMFPLTLG